MNKKILTTREVAESSNDGKINSECRECIVIQSKTEKCYELTKLNSTKTNILIITDNNKLIKDLTGCINTNKLNLSFSESEIESLPIIQHLSPTYILVDYSLIKWNIIKSLPFFKEDLCD